jgi:hypothetical protein
MTCIVLTVGTFDWSAVIHRSESLSVWSVERACVLHEDDEYDGCGRKEYLGSFEEGTLVEMYCVCVYLYACSLKVIICQTVCRLHV